MTLGLIEAVLLAILIGIATQEALNRYTGQVTVDPIHGQVVCSDQAERNSTSESGQLKCEAPPVCHLQGINGVIICLVYFAVWLLFMIPIFSALFVLVILVLLCLRCCQHTKLSIVDLESICEVESAKVRSIL
jgi:hypothetical protein